MTTKYKALLDILEDGGSAYYLQLQVNGVCSSTHLSQKQVKKIKKAAKDATIE